MTQFDLSADPATMYAAVAAMSDDEFAALMDDPPARKAIIDALVEHMAGTLRPEKAKDTEAVLHVKLWDHPEGGYDHRELVISGGTCTVSETADRPADLTLKVRPTDLRKIVTGQAGPKRLAFRGRLRAVGDLGLAMRLTDLFDLSA